MSNFATTDDLIQRWRPLTSDEIAQADTLLTDVSNALRVYAYDRGLDIDEMFEVYPARKALAVAITCDVTRREMQSLTDNSPAMSQMSQSALGYSVSGTFLSPGGGLFIKNAELRLLGLLRQKVKGVDLYVND